jgi:hypothetical protein
MKRDFQQRLAKLEWQASAWRDNLLLVAVAYYLGNPTEINLPMQAYARALGYPSTDEFGQARKKERSEVQARRTSAYKKLLAKFGVSQEYEWPAFIDALERMEAGLSDEYKGHLKWMIERQLRDYDKPSDSA